MHPKSVREATRARHTPAAHDIHIRRRHLCIVFDGNLSFLRSNGQKQAYSAAFHNVFAPTDTIRPDEAIAKIQLFQKIVHVFAKKVWK